MPTLLTPAEIAVALAVRDLTDPRAGDHAVQLLLDDVTAALAALWDCPVRTVRTRPLVGVEDNYDRLGYDPAAATRDGRYSRYTSETTMLRSHTSAGIPPALRGLAREADPPGDVLLALPGLAYRRDAVDRLHVGIPHQLDLWRLRSDDPLTGADLHGMVAAVVEAVLPGARWRQVPASHPYTVDGRQVDVRAGDDWVELAECGLAAPHVLAGAGLDPARWTGLALGMGLDRALMLRKGLPDIRLLRAADPRIAGQMLDLARWRPVSALPPVRRDISVVADAALDGELLGDLARTALGADADVLESLTVLTRTAAEDLPPAARDRLGIRPGQSNLLVRLVLRPLDRTLTDAEANALRDRVYAAVHSGPHGEWAAGQEPGR